MKKLLSLAIASTLLAGCGALFNSGPAQVTFNSDPSGAEVFIDGNRHGVTPMVASLAKDESYAIEFRREGYEPVVRTINKKVSPTYVVLDVLGGLLPVVIDAATGAWYVLDTDNVQVSMTESRTTGQLDAVQLEMVLAGVPASNFIEIE